MIRRLLVLIAICCAPYVHGQGLQANANTHWAYQPLAHPKPPLGDNRAGELNSKTAVDLFLESSWPANAITAQLLDRRSLLRRAALDLTGLPPSPDMLHAYIEDPGEESEAFSKAIDRLLASPHYGERMAQHWLDVVRYADSSGFSNDYHRGGAWRYRDYVVRAFNEDKPFRDFVLQQIAGDEIDASNPENLVAVGFLRMGPWELTGMEVAKIARQRFLDDITNALGETFLSHSLQCARCHDHKFDPIPTADYYSIQAAFATTQLAERSASYLPEENTSGFEERKYLQVRQSAYADQLGRLEHKQLAAASEWFDGLIASNKAPAKLAQIDLWRQRWQSTVREVQSAEPRMKSKDDRNSSDIFGKTRSRLLRLAVDEAEFPPKYVGFSPEDYGIERIARKGLERLRWELETYEPYALSVYSGRTLDVKSVNAPVRVPTNPMSAGELEVTRVLTGGDPFSPAEAVQPGILSAVQFVSKPRPHADPQLAQTESEQEVSEQIAGRRLRLAMWVADERNPLALRSIVNRVWQWHFGRGLAGNANNFGTMGQPPSHPQLLEWLVNGFVESGGSIKALHKTIMSSAAYRRSTWHSDKEMPDYAYFLPRRLTAEELRDVMLWSSGELNQSVGGIPIRPEIPMEVALQPRQVMGTFASAWIPNPSPHDRHRRSLYVLRLRGLPVPGLEVFNLPQPDFSCERREVTCITPQILNLLNSESTYRRGLALARRVSLETDSDSDAVALCFELTIGRKPSPSESQACLAHWKSIESTFPNSYPVPTVWPNRVQRQAIDENTGERFEFEERFPEIDDYVPDLRAADLPPHVIALANVCVAILNSHDFSFVY